MKKIKILFIGESVGDDIFITKTVIKEMDKIIAKVGNVKFDASFISSGTGEFDLKKGGVKNIKIGKIFSSIIFFPFLFLGSFIYLFIDTPSLIFTKGKYVSIPFILAAKILMIPIFLHETSSSLSSINRFISKRALTVFTSFNNTKGLDKTKELRLGYPFDKTSLNDFSSAKKNLSAILKLEINKPTLFFDSTLENNEKINDFLLNNLEDLIKKFFIFHQVSKEAYNQVKRESEIILNDETKKNYHLFSTEKDLNYINQLEDVQVIADIIISEFKETTIFKMAGLKKPSILIIFPSKQATKYNKEERRKIKSAYEYQKIGASIIFEEPNLKKHLFLAEINNLFWEDSKRKKLREMSEKAEEFATPQAGKLIATYLFEYWKFKRQ